MAQVYPDKGTVCFSAGLHGWAFTLTVFAKLYAKKVCCDTFHIAFMMAWYLHSCIVNVDEIFHRFTARHICGRISKLQCCLIYW